MPADHGLIGAWSQRLELALRKAQEWHGSQMRRGANVLYLTHPLAVAMILIRHGFAEETVIAGILHDTVEDTNATIDGIRSMFGNIVAEIVASCSERKSDESGVNRPWSDRKREYLEGLAAGSIDARAVALADKLHNLASIRFDLERGRDVFAMFHADREHVLKYYRESIERFGANAPTLSALQGECFEAFTKIEELGREKRRSGGVTG